MKKKRVIERIMLTVWMGKPAKKEAALENYENQIKQLEQDYQKQISQLEKEISKRQREVRDLRANKPEALAEVITEKFGFEYVP